MLSPILGVIPISGRWPEACMSGRCELAARWKEQSCYLSRLVGYEVTNELNGVKVSQTKSELLKRLYI